MKKVVLLLMVAAFAITVVGCGAKDEGGPGSKPEGNGGMQPAQKDNAPPKTEGM